MFSPVVLSVHVIALGIATVVSLVEFDSNAVVVLVAHTRVTDVVASVVLAGPSVVVSAVVASVVLIGPTKVVSAVVASVVLIGPTAVASVVLIGPTAAVSAVVTSVVLIGHTTVDSPVVASTDVTSAGVASVVLLCEVVLLVAPSKGSRVVAFCWEGTDVSSVDGLMLLGSWVMAVPNLVTVGVCGVDVSVE